MKRLFLIFIYICFFITAKTQVITFGPMLHCYFPQGKPKVTIGFEIALYYSFIPISYLQSLDFGVEGGKNVNFIYGEFQMARMSESFVATGISFGIFQKQEKEKSNITGFQTTIWKCYYGGGDVRLRLAKDYIDGGIGAFGKLAIPFTRIGT